MGLQFSQILNDGVLTNMQWPGIGARASVELRYRASSADLALAPFLQYWWVDDSTAAQFRPHALSACDHVLWGLGDAQSLFRIWPNSPREV